MKIQLTFSTFDYIISVFIFLSSLLHEFGYNTFYDVLYILLSYINFRNTFCTKFSFIT
jgi:hypothetical protein